MTLPDVRRRCQKQNLAFARYSMTYFTFCSLWLVSAAFHIAMVPLATNRGTPTVPDNGGASYPLESLLGHFNQDFPGIFPPWHRPLSLLQCSEPLQGLWLFEQPLHIIPTVEMYARMAVYALSDGTVLINNPIAPTEETLQEIEDIFGEPDHVIIPTTSYNSMVFVEGWAKRFSRTTFWRLEGAKLPGAKLTRDLTLESFPEEWRSELDLSIMEGNRIFRECFILHRATKSVFAMDSLIEMGEENIRNPVLRAGAKMTGNFERPMCPTKALLRNREQCKAAVSRVLDWDFDIVYATHETCPIF
ncbi:unnamed protein product [Ascophyllum nodosum]